MSSSVPKHLEFELAAEYPHRKQGVWLVTLFHYDSGLLVASVTTSDAGWLKAINRCMVVMGQVMHELETTGQLLMDQGDTQIRYGEAIVRA